MSNSSIATYDNFKASSKHAHWQQLLYSIKHKQANHGAIKNNGKPPRYFLSGKYQGLYLTAREHNVLVYLLKGFSHKEIALQEDISLRTVEDHTAKLRKKLGFDRKQEMIRSLLAINFLESLTH